MLSKLMFHDPNQEHNEGILRNLEPKERRYVERNMRKCGVAETIFTLGTWGSFAIGLAVPIASIFIPELRPYVFPTFLVGCGPCALGNVTGVVASQEARRVWLDNLAEAPYHQPDLTSTITYDVDFHPLS